MARNPQGRSFLCRSIQKANGRKSHGKRREPLEVDLLNTLVGNIPRNPAFRPKFLPFLVSRGIVMSNLSLRTNKGFKPTCWFFPLLDSVGSMRVEFLINGILIPWKLMLGCCGIQFEIIMWPHPKCGWYWIFQSSETSSEFTLVNLANCPGWGGLSNETLKRKVSQRLHDPFGPAGEVLVFSCFIVLDTQLIVTWQSVIMKNKMTKSQNTSRRQGGPFAMFHYEDSHHEF